MTTAADVQLLSRAADYALDAADTITADLWPRPTPCVRWNLQMLLRHTCESVAAVHEGLATGRVALFPHPDDHPPADLTCLLRTRLSMLIDEWSTTTGGHVVAIADHDVAISVMASAAALEIAVHGWDIAQAGGHERSIPPELAGDLLPVAARLLADDNRHPLFGPPVPLAETACPGDQLVAFLGRRPHGVRSVPYLAGRGTS
jgi:uncharacterized protein (TIGR03086 family)